MDNTQYGVITEVGDLSLGFQPLNEEDNKIYSNYVNKVNTPNSPKESSSNSNSIKTNSSAVND